MSYRDYDKNKWVEISWNTFAKTQKAVSRALLHAGVKVQERVAVFSQNKPECLFVDFGAYAIRAVTIPFFATSSPAQVAYMIQDAQIRYVFVGEQQQYDTTFSVISSCPILPNMALNAEMPKPQRLSFKISGRAFLNIAHVTPAGM